MTDSVRTASPTPHIREKRRRRKSEILRAALKAFRERGYHETTLQDIADGLGIQKTALYHYFPDKEAILFACHAESLAEIERILEHAHGERGAEERLRTVIREHVRLMTETLEGSPFSFEVTSLNDVHQHDVIRRRDKYERTLRSIISDGTRSGEFRGIDPKVAVFAILGAINWIARWYKPGGSLKAKELGDQFVDLLVGGLLRG